MSDSCGSLFKERYEMIAREYGSRIANLDFHVIDIGDPIYGPMVIPRMGRARRANDDVLLEKLRRPIGGVSLPESEKRKESKSAHEIIQEFLREEQRRKERRKIERLIQGWDQGMKLARDCKKQQEILEGLKEAVRLAKKLAKE